MPVHGSQPAAAEYDPLLPLVVSRNAAGAPYSALCSGPTLWPTDCWTSAVSPAHSGATALVPPKTSAWPSTKTW
jgi:hypothetical protein